MPSRPFTWLILAFWAAMTGWLLYRDVWPRLQPGEPPPFAIDLADEASASVQKSFWTLFKDGIDVGSVETSVKYHAEDDTFEIPGLLKLWLTSTRGKEPDVRIDSRYRVTREGELRELAADAEATHFGAWAHLDGAVKDNLFTLHFRLTGPGFKFEPTLKPVAVSRRGNVFNPRQPVNKLRGLRPGQRWHMPMVDPLTDTLSAAASQAVPGFRLPDLPMLQAEVLPDVQMLPALELKPVKSSVPQNPRRSGVPCLVIRYTSADITAHTWVRESDGLVLRQDVTQPGETWILDRD